MRYVVPVLILAVGCGPSSPPVNERPRIRINRVEIREDEVPTRVVFHVHNGGNVPAVVDSIRLTVTAKAILHDDATLAPANLDCRVVMLDADGAPVGEGETIDVAPRESTQIVAELQWQLPRDASPKLAVVQAAFTLFGSRVPHVISEETAFVMQSQRGTLDAVLSKVAGNRESLRNVIKGFSGVGSPGFGALRNHLGGGNTY
jgi:hypothetical protein